MDDTIFWAEIYPVTTWDYGAFEVAICSGTEDHAYRRVFQITPYATRWTARRGAKRLLRDWRRGGPRYRARTEIVE